MGPGVEHRDDGVEQNLEGRALLPLEERGGRCGDVAADGGSHHAEARYAPLGRPFAHECQRAADILGRKAGTSVRHAVAEHGIGHAPLVEPAGEGIPLALERHLVESTSRAGDDRLAVGTDGRPEQQFGRLVTLRPGSEPEAEKRFVVFHLLHIVCGVRPVRDGGSYNHSTTYLVTR